MSSCLHCNKEIEGQKYIHITDLLKNHADDLCICEECLKELYKKEKFNEPRKT